jgi:hypothetical protein
VLFQDSTNRKSMREAEAAAVAGKGEQAIAEWLRSIGGKVQMRGGHVAEVSLKSTSITDRELAVLAGFPQLVDLSLRDTEVSEIGLSHLASIRSLEKLDLGYTLLGDGALAKLAPLEGCRVSWAVLIEGPGLAAIEGLGGLRSESRELALEECGLAAHGKLAGLRAFPSAIQMLPTRACPIWPASRDCGGSICGVWISPTRAWGNCPGSCSSRHWI